MRFTTSAVSCVALAIVFLPSCARRVRYEDDLDVGGLQKTFQCGPDVKGDRAHACRILADYASAGRFEAAPTKKLESWFGRKVCLDTIDSSTRFDFGQVHLQPGLGVALFPKDVKVDPSRDVPYGAQFIATYTTTKVPGMRPGHEAMFAAAAKGAVPTFEGSPDPASHQRLWESVKRPPGTAEFYRLVQSTGPSILGGQSITGETAVRPSATYFVRGKDARMLVVYPGAGTPCVAELWRVHTE